MKEVSEPLKYPQYTIKFKDNSSLTTSDVYLNRVHNPDIGRIPKTAHDYLKLSKPLTVTDMDTLVSPTNAQNEDDKLFLEWHNKLDHLPDKQLLKSSEVGNTPKIISRAFKQRRLPVFTSCIFGQAYWNL